MKQNSKLKVLATIRQVAGSETMVLVQKNFHGKKIEK